MILIDGYADVTVSFGKYCQFKRNRFNRSDECFLILPPLNDVLKYGMPFGMLAFLIFAADAFYLNGELSFWRWLVVGIMIPFGVVWNIRRSNKNHFPFFYAFLSGFNIVIASIIIHAILMAIFADSLIDMPLEGETGRWQWLGFLIFIEGLGQAFVSILALVLISFLLKKKK